MSEILLQREEEPVREKRIRKRNINDEQKEEETIEELPFAKKRQVKKEKRRQKVPEKKPGRTRKVKKTKPSGIVSEKEEQPPSIPGHKLIEKIGAGGFGKVYLGETETGAKVAIKVMKKDTEKLQDLEQKIREINSRIDHPNVVKVLHAKLDNELPHVIMEYYGKELNVKKERTLQEKISIAITIGETLSYLHSKGVIHKDVKPGNILEYEGQIKLTDLEVAQITREKEGLETSLRTTAREGDAKKIIGTIKYMSPEQQEGKEVDKRTDIYSWGVVFYELLTGQKPGYEAREELRKKNIPEDVINIILKAVKREKEERYETIDAALKDIYEKGYCKYLITEKKTNDVKQLKTPNRNILETTTERLQESKHEKLYQEEKVKNGEEKEKINPAIFEEKFRNRVYRRGRVYNQAYDLNNYEIIIKSAELIDKLNSILHKYLPANDFSLTKVNFKVKKCELIPALKCGAFTVRISDSTVRSEERGFKPNELLSKK